MWQTSDQFSPDRAIYLFDHHYHHYDHRDNALEDFQNFPKRKNCLRMDYEKHLPRIQCELNRREGGRGREREERRGVGGGGGIRGH